MALTHEGAAIILRGLTGKASSVSLASNCYIGLSTHEPSSQYASNFVEPVGNGYRRALAGSSGATTTIKFGEPSQGSITNKDLIIFPECTNETDENGWGTVGWFGIFTAETGGTLLAYGALTSSVQPTNGYVPVFRAGQLTLSIT